MGEIIIQTKHGSPVQVIVNGLSVQEQVEVLKLLRTLLPVLAKLRKESDDGTTS